LNGLKRTRKMNHMKLRVKINRSLNRNDQNCFLRWDWSSRTRDWWKGR
jgi:hypothetical protein